MSDYDEGFAEGLEARVQDIEELQSKLTAKDARIAELEAKVKMHESPAGQEYLGSLDERILTLESSNLALRGALEKTMWGFTTGDRTACFFCNSSFYETDGKHFETCEGVKLLSPSSPSTIESKALRGR